ARLATGVNVVGADIAGAIAIDSITVLGDDERLRSGTVEHLGLIDRINRANGNTFDPLGQQIVNNTLLFGSRTFAGHAKFDFDILYFVSSFFGSSARNNPEFGSVVRHECDFMAFPRATASRN